MLHFLSRVLVDLYLDGVSGDSSSELEEEELSEEEESGESSLCLLCVPLCFLLCLLVCLALRDSKEKIGSGVVVDWSLALLW